jgi:hypothetical protein
MDCELHDLERQLEPCQLLLEDRRNQETYSQVGGPAARNISDAFCGSGKQKNAVLL